MVRNVQLSFSELSNSYNSSTSLCSSDMYANEVKKKIEEGVPIESVEIDLSLTRIKSTHALWLIELFNFLTSEEGKKTILNG